MATRDEVLAAAQRHLNVDPRASMAVLAAAAGVGRATLHRHFASRDDLLHELGTRELDTETAAATLGVAVKYREDAERVKQALDVMLTR